MSSLPPERVATWRSFLEAHAAVVEVLARELQAQEDLPLSWYDVLVHLSEAPGRRLRMQELADAVLLSKSGLTRLVQRLEVAGLVNRVPCDDDRRGTWAVLSEAGLTRLRDAYPAHVQGVDQHFASHLSDAEVASLGDILGRIAEAGRRTLAES